MILTSLIIKKLIINKDSKVIQLYDDLEDVEVLKLEKNRI